MKFFLSIISISLVFSLGLSGQCPDRDFLWRRIVYLRDSSNVPFSEQKDELLTYLEKMQVCPYRNDSTHALLLQRIGWLYSQQKDFVRAIQYTKESINLVSKNLGKPGVNYAHVIKSYFNLQILYDSCAQYGLKRQAVDSCVAISVKLHKGQEYALYLLLSQTASYLESGDYYRSIDAANIGDLLIEADPSYSSYLPYFLSWKINGLILLYRFDEAEQLLKMAITSRHGSSFLGTYYGLLARLAEEKNDEKNSLHYVEKSVSVNEKMKNLKLCAQTINNLAFNLYFKRLKKYGVALFHYQRALKYADASEALNIYENIANVYVELKMYDSAFYFFQKSFDQIKTGTNEHNLLVEGWSNSMIEYVEYIMDLVVDKADAYLKYYRSGGGQANLYKAIASYEIIDRLFDKIRKSQGDIQSKLFWRSQIRRLYEHAIDACYLAKNSADAFYFLRKAGRSF